VTGPAWVAPGLAALMLLIAASCAIRLAWRPRGRPTEADADGLHVLMGVAMAGMFEPRLSPISGATWQAVFAVAAAWFSWQAVRARGRRPGGWQCAQPAPHAVECAAMLYMLVAVRSGGGSGAMPMPGVGGLAVTGANPAVALVLALFMLSYVLWTTDRLATQSRARTGRPEAGYAAGLAVAPLAPRFAACYKIAMSAAMGYMLITML
jgi:hypothetical protein